MNAKEARDFIKKYKENMPNSFYEADLNLMEGLCMSKGFLEAVEKMGPVLEALETIAKAGTYNSLLADKLKSSWHYYRREVLGE